MKILLSINFVLLILTLSLAEDCNEISLVKAIEMYQDFDAIHNRACHDLKININSYQMIRKKCVKDLIEGFDYDDSWNDLATEFMESECFTQYNGHICDDHQYLDFKHCVIDFGMDHLEEIKDFYKNITVVNQLYDYSIKAKECFNKSLNEIEAKHFTEEIHV